MTKKIVINGANGKMGQALKRLIDAQPELGLEVVFLREAGQVVPVDFDAVIDFSTPQGAQEAFLLAKRCRTVAV